MLGVSLTLDFLLPDGTIDIVWREGDEEDSNSDSGFWLESTIATDGTETTNLKVAVTQDDFIKHGQTDFKTLNQNIPVTAQFAWRDEYGTVIIANAFTATVIGNGEESECVNELVKKDTGAQDLKLAFDANSEDGMWKHVEIPRTLETIAEIDTCNAVFKLLIFSSAHGDYVVFDELKKDMEAELGGILSSWIHFNSTTGDLEAMFYQEDIDPLRVFFNDATTGEATMKFHVVGTVPGSIVMGPEIDDSAKVVADFTIVFIDNTVVETCASNVLSKTGKTYVDDT
jgi:hypothetical protein